MRPLWALALAGLVGCTSAQQVRADLRTGATKGAQVEGVPFVEQRDMTCGAAALAAVLQHQGRSVTEPALAKALRTRQATGAITYELAIEARRQGMLAAQRYDVSAGQLMGAIDAGLTPIILRGSLAHAWLGVYHYTVLTAYDLKRQVWIAHDGDAADVLIDFDELAADHMRADRWALIVSDPSQRPTGLAPKVHLELGVQAEKAGHAQAAQHHYAHAAWTVVSGQALLNLSNVSGQTRDWAQAEAQLRAALLIDPDSAAIRNNLAWVLLQRRERLDESEALARQAAEDPAVRPHALDTLARIKAARATP